MRSDLEFRLVGMVDADPPEVPHPMVASVFGEAEASVFT